MELNDPRFQSLLKLMEDYDDLILKDDELQTQLYKFLTKGLDQNEDPSDEEILGFEKLLKVKIEKYVKEKGN